MQRRHLIRTLLVTAIGGTTLSAMAQGPHGGPPSHPGPNRPHPSPAPHQPPRPPAQVHRPAPPPPPRHPQAAPGHRPAPPPDRHYNARGPEFRKGAHLPADLRHRNYFVTDYRIHRLPPPPARHHWVQVGPDYVLVNRTGLIINVVIGR